MGAEFLFTIELNFRFLFVLQITRRVDAQGGGDRKYEQIRGRGRGLSQTGRGTEWKYFLNWSQMIDIG